MSNPSSRKKALIKFALHTLLAVGVSASVTAIAAYWVTEQSDRARHRLKQELLADIQSQSEHQSAAITASEQKLTQHMQPFITRLEALDSQMLSGMQTHQRLQNALDTLANEIAEQTKGIQTLKKQLRAVERRPSGNTVATPKPKKPSPSQVVTKDLPFRLFDVQKRGLSYVAIIGPKQTSSVSGLMVLSAGHRYQGWRLDSVTREGVQVSQGHTQLFLAPQGGA